MDIRKLRDAQFDALLVAAVSDCFESEISRLSAVGEQEGIHTFSARHERRMRKLFRRERHKASWVAARKYLYRAAVILTAASALAFGILMTDSGVRAAVRKTVIEWFDKFTRFDFSGGGVEPGTYYEWEPGYVPEGYSLSDLSGTTRIYISETDNLFYFTYTLSEHSSLAVDNEDSVYQTITEKGILYHIFISEAADKYSGIVWEREGYTFHIEGQLYQDELLKIAVSVIKQ